MSLDYRALTPDDPDSGTPNLDGMDPDDLEEFIEEVMDETTIPKCIRLQLASYASHKALAMRHRGRGYIGIARKEEAHCDRIYNALPIMYQF